MGEDWEAAKQEVYEEEAAKQLAPRETVTQLIREQCVFDALQGQKSHWFRFMKVLIDGCVVQKDEFADSKVKIIQPECFVKALKFSQVYSNYDQEKFKDCLVTQMKDIDAHKKDPYTTPLSRNYLDRDFKYK